MKKIWSVRKCEEAAEKILSKIVRTADRLCLSLSSDAGTAVLTIVVVSIFGTVLQSNAEGPEKEELCRSAIDKMQDLFSTKYAKSSKTNINVH